MGGRRRSSPHRQQGGGHRGGEAAGPAGLWRAPSAVRTLLSSPLYSRKGVGGLSGSNRRRLVKGSCQNPSRPPPPPPPTPPAFSFQFNDQTSAWKKGGGAGGTEGSPRRRCCVCMSGTGGHPSPLPLPPAGPVPPLPSDRAPAAREGRGGERRRRRRQRGSRECQCSVRLLARTHCGEVGEGGRCVPFPPVPFLTLTSRGQSPAERNKGKWGGKPTPAAAAPETPREAEPSGSR